MSSTVPVIWLMFNQMFMRDKATFKNKTQDTQDCLTPNCSHCLMINLALTMACVPVTRPHQSALKSVQEAAPTQTSFGDGALESHHSMAFKTSKL